MKPVCKVSESLSHTESGRQSVSKQFSYHSRFPLLSELMHNTSVCGVSHVDSLLASEQDPEISGESKQESNHCSEEDVKRLQALLWIYTLIVRRLWRYLNGSCD